MPVGTPLSFGGNGNAAAYAHSIVGETEGQGGIPLHQGFDGDVVQLRLNNAAATGHEHGNVSPKMESFRLSTGPSPRSGAPQDPVAISSPTLQLPPGGSSQSRISSVSKRINLWRPRAYNHWKAPILMLLFYSIGLALSLAHCVIYRDLDGKIVGSSYDQEQNLRYIRHMVSKLRKDEY